VDIQRIEAEDPTNPGMPLWSPSRRELLDLLERLEGEEADRIYEASTFLLPQFRSRHEAIALVERGRAGDPRHQSMLVMQAFHVGYYDDAEQFLSACAETDESEGRVAVAVSDWSQVARIQLCRGELADARRTLDHVADLVSRLTRESVFLIQYLGALDEEWFATGGPYAPLLQRFAPLAATPDAANQWVMAAVLAAIGRGMAMDGMLDQALAFLAQTIPSIEQADGATSNYARVVCHAAEILWQANRTDHADTIERNLRDKIIAPDFRYPMVDGRRSLAQICALTARSDEARDWFAKARTVLDEQGARPLRAIVDYDEALMYIRRNAPGDTDRAQPLLAAATRQFREIGMPGWLDRASKLAE
jgi:tetratricopeptide (TPR) repeat protein